MAPHRPLVALRARPRLIEATRTWRAPTMADTYNATPSVDVLTSTHGQEVAMVTGAVAAAEI